MEETKEVAGGATLKLYGTSLKQALALKQVREQKEVRVVSLVEVVRDLIAEAYTRDAKEREGKK
jgi:hypothetical protein